MILLFLLEFFDILGLFSQRLLDAVIRLLTSFHGSLTLFDQGLYRGARAQIGHIIVVILLLRNCLSLFGLLS